MPHQNRLCSSAPKLIGHALERVTEQKVQQLEERVRQLHETVQFMERERNRLKGEIDTIKHQVNKR